MLLISLPVGIYISNFLGETFHHRYYDGDFGYYYGSVNGTAIINDRHANVFVYFKGKTEPKWNWIKPQNFKYPKLSLEIQGMQEDKIIGELFFPSFRLKQKDSSLVLTQNEFNRITLGKYLEKVPKKTKEKLAKIYELINAAGRGKISPPRHHPYSIEIPGGYINFTHFSLGGRYYYTIFLWILIWISIFIYVIIKRKN